MGERLRVSDVITSKEIVNWNNGDIVSISAGTGAGKSYFIKNILYKYAAAQGKKILMLVHRTNCSNQFKMEIEDANKSNVIEVKTYQSIENALINGVKIDFDCYAYIVSDEFHYFTEDSAFNNCTDISFEAIMNYRNGVKIFMSATGETAAEVLKQYVGRKVKIHPYNIESDYSYFKSLEFFYKDDVIKTLAYKFKADNKKAIFFIQSVEKAHELYNEFRDCSLFLCGKNSKSGIKYSKDIKEEKIATMLKNEKFDELFLITTTCFDAGANIIDTDLNNIVADIKSVSSLIQCLGRKRSQGAGDKVNVYIKAISGNQLGGMRTKRNKEIEKADYLLKHGTSKYVEEYSRDKTQTILIYDEPMSARNKNTCTKKVNKMIYAKYKADIEQYDKIISMGYPQYIAPIFKFGTSFHRFYTIREEKNLKEYLYILYINQVVMHTSDEKKEFINKMNVKHEGHLLKSRNSLNSVLAEKRYGYIINEKDCKYQGKRHRHSWIIDKCNTI